MIDYQSDGYLQKSKNGFDGQIKIENIDLSPIEGMFFIHEKTKKSYLWIKRKPLLEYNDKKNKYEYRPREPRWEVYLEKQTQGNIHYIGEFIFLHLKYKIVGIWDKNDLSKKKQRINFYIERMPTNQQTIINENNERNNGYK